MSLADAALRQDIEGAKKRILDGERPRDVFERVIFSEAREQMEKDKRR